MAKPTEFLFLGPTFSNAAIRSSNLSQTESLFEGLSEVGHTSRKNRQFGAREEWEGTDYHRPPEVPERALWLAIYNRAITDAAQLPRALWRAWREQIDILGEEARRVPYSQPYLRHKALEKVIVAKKRLQLSREAHEWLDSWCCSVVRELADIDGEIQISDLSNQPFDF